MGENTVVFLIRFTFIFQGFPWIIMVMSKYATLSTNIDSDLKKALSMFCKRKGLKIQSVVENGIREQLEDELDLAAYEERKNEEEISLSTVLKNLKK